MVVVQRVLLQTCLLVIAWSVVRSMPVPAGLVHGPMTTPQALCIYTDKHRNLLRASFDSCWACVDGCSKWADCDNLFFDSINITRSSIYKFNCVALQAWRRGTFSKDSGQAILTAALTSGASMDPKDIEARLAAAPRDTAWFTVHEKGMIGRMVIKLPGGVAPGGRGEGDKILQVCLLEAVPGGGHEKELEGCVGHVGYTWEGSAHCHVNAMGKACLLPLDPDRTVYFQNHSMLEWLPKTLPPERLVIGWKIPKGDKAAMNAVLCRGRYGGGVYVGTMVFSGSTPKADDYRCYVYHIGHVVTLAGFEVLGIADNPNPAGEGCSAECKGQLQQNFPGSISMVDGARVLAVDAGACCALCRSVPGCVAWVYDIQGSGQCTLKWRILEGYVEGQSCTASHLPDETKSVGGVVANPLTLSDVVGDCHVPQGIIEDRRYDARPGSVVSMLAQSFGECCNQCRQHAACKAFSWNRVWQSCEMTSSPVGLLDNLVYISARMRP